MNLERGRNFEMFRKVSSLRLYLHLFVTNEQLSSCMHSIMCSAFIKNTQVFQNVVGKNFLPRNCFG